MLLAMHECKQIVHMFFHQEKYLGFFRFGECPVSQCSSLGSKSAGIDNLTAAWNLFNDWVLYGPGTLAPP
eukprot:m.1664494 g.1664494  ORF g.1664494 m.1664494 type:complete len:70 (+) comp139319_c0_seq1:116-325(+)